MTTTYLQLNYPNMIRQTQPHLILPNGSHVWKWVQKHTENLSNAIDSLMTSAKYSRNTSALEFGEQKTGVLSMQQSVAPPHLPMPNEITAQDLNLIQKEKFGNVSTRMRLEHRAVEKVMNSLSAQSLQKGFNNIAVIYQPQALIRLMVNEGILPEDCGLGRKRFCGTSYLTRTALSAPIAFLEENEEKIKEWVEDNTKHSADDVYNILRAGSVIGASLGYVDLASNTLHTFYSRMRALPDAGSRSKVLRDKDRILRLISSD